MQTIFLDVSHKGVYPAINAQQGDVGRSFKAIIHDAGIPYDISDCIASVWFEGPSGSGNYTDSGELTSIVVDENELTITLIPQMLINEGEGTLSVSLNFADGRQIGLWTIPYFVEKKSGSTGGAAGDYFQAFSADVAELKAMAEQFSVDSTLTKPGKAADAAATGNKFAFVNTRIDQIASLGEGSTTGDAELIDGRIGADGVVYPSIGSAIRSQVANIENSFDSVTYGNILNPLNSVLGRFSQSEANLQEGKPLVVYEGNETGRYRSVMPIPIYFDKTKTSYLRFRTTLDEESTASQIIVYFLDKDQNYIGKDNATFKDILAADNLSYNMRIKYPDAVYIHVEVSGANSGHNFGVVCISVEYLPAFEVFGNKKTFTLKDTALPAQSPVTNGMKMLFFGDSITETADMNDDGSNYNPSKRYNYPIPLSEALQAGEIRNFARHGATIRDTGYQWIRFDKTTNEAVLTPKPNYYNQADNPEWLRSTWYWVYTWFGSAEELNEAITSSGADKDERYTVDDNLEWRWVAKSGINKRMNLSEQIDMALEMNSKDEFIPDIVVISLGTNDSDAVLSRPNESQDTYEEALSLKNLSDFNYNERATMHKALRYAMWSIKTAYPNAKCFVGTPTQRTAFEIPEYTLKAIKSMGNRCNFIVVDAQSESGIIRETCYPPKWENKNAENDPAGVEGVFDTYDGLHTTRIGSQKLADLYGSVILNSFLTNNYKK